MSIQATHYSSNISKILTYLIMTDDQKVKSSTDNQAKDKNKCKPCCACPETRKLRDICIVERGEEECAELIEAHKNCMRKLGYKVA